MMTTSAFTLLFRWACCWVLLFLVNNPASAKVVFNEVEMESLGRVPPETYAVRVNETGTLAVCSIKRDDGKQFVTINGKAGPPFDWVGYLYFNLDAEHVTYLANRGGKQTGNRWKSRLDGGQWYKVVDGHESQAYESEAVAAQSGAESPKGITSDPFSSTSLDGLHVASVTHEDDKWSVVLDGKAGAVYDWAAWPVFSPDGKRLAHVAYRVNKARPSGSHFVVFDGQEGTFYDEILGGGPLGSSICFSPDSQHMAYVARHIGFQDDHQYGDMQFVVLDGKEGPRSNSFYAVPSPVFSSDSQWMANGTWHGSKYFMLVNNVLGGSTESRGYEQLWLPHNQPTAIVHFFGLRDGTIYRVEATESD